LPLVFEYNPNVLAVQEVRQGDFISEGSEPIAVVQRNDELQGRCIISATRPPNVPGVTGSGPVLEIVVRGVASGTSPLSIGAVNATTSRRTKIGFFADPARIQVSP